MSATVDAVAEVALFGLSDEVERPNGRRSLNNDHDDIVADRQAILEISKMADRMTLMIQEIRNTNVETDDRLRMLEEDLKLIEMEK